MEINLNTLALIEADETLKRTVDTMGLDFKKLSEMDTSNTSYRILTLPEFLLAKNGSLNPLKNFASNVAEFWSIGNKMMQIEDKMRAMSLGLTPSCAGYYKDIVPVVHARVSVQKRAAGGHEFRLINKPSVIPETFSWNEEWSHCLIVVAVAQKRGAEKRSQLEPIGDIAPLEDGRRIEGETDVWLPWSPRVVNYELWGDPQWPLQGCPGTKGPYVFDKAVASKQGLELMLTIPCAESLGDRCRDEEARESCFCRTLNYRAKRAIQ